MCPAGSLKASLLGPHGMDGSVGVQLVNRETLLKERNSTGHSVKT